MSQFPAPAVAGTEQGGEKQLKRLIRLSASKVPAPGFVGGKGPGPDDVCATKMVLGSWLQKLS